MALGINCASKLRKIRKKYKAIKTSPFKLRPHTCNAVVLENVDLEAKQPNSALRKCVKVQISKTKEKKLVFVPLCGGRTFIKPHDVVTITSIGGSKGRAKGDLSGLNYKVVKINKVALREKFLRKK